MERRKIPSESPIAVKEVAKIVKEVASIPVMVKLTVKADDIGVIAKAAEEGGSDAVSSMNTYRNVIGIDIESGKPLMPVFGVYSGPAIKPIALGAIVKMAKSVNIQYVTLEE
jgi:dihydroorotate dehydrogenase